jgi:hypothetical protein
VVVVVVEVEGFWKLILLVTSLILDLAVDAAVVDVVVDALALKKRKTCFNRNLEYIVLK